MMRFVIVAIIGLMLTGCSNTKELIFGNIHVVYFPKNDTNPNHIVIGSPSQPYAQEPIKFYFKDGLVIDLSGEDLINTIQSKYACGRAVIRDVSGKVGPFIHPAQSFGIPWSKGTFAHQTALMEIYYNNDKAIGFDIDVSNKDLAAIEVKGIRKNFPLTESDVKDLFGTPDKVLLYFSE